MSKHELAIREFLAERPTWQRFGLRRELNKIFDDSPLGALHFLPDAFEIDPPRVRLLEVDGHSYIGPKKMSKVVNLWFDLDCRSWFCELHLINLFAGAYSIVTDDDLMRRWHDLA